MARLDLCLLLALIVCVLQTMAIDIHVTTSVEKRVNTACVSINGCAYGCKALSTTSKKVAFTPQCTPASSGPLSTFYVYGTLAKPYVVTPSVPGKISCTFIPSRLHVSSNFVCTYFPTAPPLFPPVAPPFPTPPSVGTGPKTCTGGTKYAGKRNGNGPIGACCKVDDDCIESCIKSRCQVA